MNVKYERHFHHSIESIEQSVGWWIGMGLERGGIEDKIRKTNNLLEVLGTGDLRVSWGLR